MEELEWWKLLGQQTRQSPIIAAEVVSSPSRSMDAQPAFDVPFETIGTVGGGAVGFTMYAWTYPIVWIDGPLPIVDAFWLAGLAVSTGRGANTGRRIGQRLDTIEEVLL